jgi:tetratricopeptide (TPR) repeat protein
MELALAYELHTTMKNSKIKILIVLLGALVVFFAITFFQKWDVTVANKTADDYKDRVKAIKKDYKKAKVECPKIVQSLQDALPELEKNKLEAKVFLSYKLIADCEYASKKYASAAKNYLQLIRADPQSAMWHYLYAKSSMQDGDLGEALRAAHLAVQLNRKAFEPSILEARVLAKLNETVRAIDAYQNALKIAPYKEIDTVKKELNQLIEIHNQQIIQSQSLNN